MGKYRELFDKVVEKINFFALKIKEIANFVVGRMDELEPKYKKTAKRLVGWANFIVIVMILCIGVLDEDKHVFAAYVMLITLLLMWATSIVASFVAGMYKLLPFWLQTFYSVVSGWILVVMCVPGVIMLKVDKMLAQVEAGVKLFIQQ